MTSRRLLIVPCCGLCNRIQTVICAQLLAEDTGRDLGLHWLPEHNCGASFEDLFLPHFPVVDTLPDEARCYSSIQRHIVVATERHAAILRRNPRQWFARIRSDRSEAVAIFSCHQFSGYFHDPRFAVRVRELFARVRPEITAVAEAFRAKHFTGNTVGVHIRRGDWRRQQGLEYYAELMRGFPGATFLISTDDLEAFAQIQTLYPDAIRFPASPLHRSNRQAVVDALIEVILLSRTRFLIGTPGSSFSAIARTAGDIPGNFDYGLSLSRRDLKLGNVPSLRQTLHRRVFRRKLFLETS